MAPVLVIHRFRRRRGRRRHVPRRARGGRWPRAVPSGRASCGSRSAATSTTRDCGSWRPAGRDAGDYRRGLSAYDVKVRAWGVLARAIDEPSAYEVDRARPGDPTQARPRGNGGGRSAR